MMDAATKAKFILALHKHSLQAFDSGGTVLGGPSGGGTNGPGGITGAIGGFLGLNPESADLQQGTNTAQLNNAYTGVQGALAGQQQYSNQAAGQGGFNNQSNVFNQQQALADQLALQASGQGPNPAQAALNQSTGQNVAAQAALMAGQRGASANPGLIARQIAQQGAATQQQAVGQGATLQAQQQLAAQAALAQQQAQLQNVAANQINTQGQAVTGLTNAQQNEQGILQGANSAYNNSAVNMQENINSANPGKSIFGGIAGLAGDLPAIGKFLGLAEGGDVDGESPKYPSALFASGGMASPMGPKSFAGQWLSGSSPVMAKAMGGDISPKLAAQGGKVKAGSPDQKASVKNNSLKNDKVPALLSEGEIVIPRSITQHPMAAEKAAQFVQAVLNKRKMGKSK